MVRCRLGRRTFPGANETRWVRKDGDSLQAGRQEVLSGLETILCRAFRIRALTPCALAPFQHFDSRKQSHGLDVKLRSIV